MAHSANCSNQRPPPTPHRVEPVFGDGTVPTALRLIESVSYPKGALHVTYETAGMPTYGDMAGGDQ
jgi:hypothetical protein